MVVGRIQKFGATIWDHKKKTIFGALVLTWAGRWANRKNRNNKIRTAYALEAKRYGDMPISAEDRCKRVVVLANVSANERACFDDFTANALPLLHLAGIEVTTIKADNEAQLEALAAAVDHEEADSVYVVGGDGTLGRVLTGILRNREAAIMPLGVFPGGYDNLTLKRLMPAVFTDSSDIRKQCESAMAVIEDLRSDVRPFKVHVEGSEEKPLYSIGDVGAGWYRHIEDKRRRLWWMGSLKRRWAYVLEMIKRSPEPLDLHVEWEEYCSGCNRCRKAPEVQEVQWRWWHILTGSPQIVVDKSERDFSNVVNENCGRKGEKDVTCTELLLHAEQKTDEERCGLRLLTGGEDSGRFGVIQEGWSRCGADLVHQSANEAYFTTNVFARAFLLQLNHIPEFVRKLFVSSDPMKGVEEGSRVRVEAVDSKIQLLLPRNLRVNPDLL